MILFYVALFGLIIGSFLNVCIYRLPREMSVMAPMRSFCPQCETQLKWFDNIPVLSWVLLNGRCRYCKNSISGQYPLVEIVSGIAAASSYIQFGPTPTALIIYALSASLITISFIDFEFKIIPNVISFPGITFGLLLGIASQFTHAFPWPITQNAWDSVVGMYAGGGFFYGIGLIYYFFTKQVGLGMGDVKLMGMTGAILGWHSVAPTIFVGSMLGSIVGLAMIIFRGGGRKSEIPFGPWLSIGALVYVFCDLPWLRF